MSFRLANVDGRAALVVDDLYYDLEEASEATLSSDLMAALSVPDQLSQISADLAGKPATGNVAEVVLGPPVPRPQKVFGIGLNYRSHAAESNMAVPDEPVVFTKFPSCLVGPNADVEMRSDAVDWEIELVVVIGTGGKDISAESAWDHVVGAMGGQDISDRAAQFAAKPAHFDLGKSFDTFGPIGPYLVSTDAFTDPNDIALTCAVNGEEKQNDSTSNLIFDVPFLISYLSHRTTLMTGDLIFTGTPDGIGAAEGRFLRDGDVISSEVAGVGSFTNRCRRVSDHN